MRVSLKPKHLKRYKDIALLLIKHGRSDVVKHAGLHNALELDASVETKASESKADELAQDLERLGPTFIKLGQLLSTRADFLPPAYIHALTRLQDKIDPFPFEQVEAIFSGELGVRISKAFSEFEAKPLATASLGQVHRATMLDGRAVVVKVQRPGNANGRELRLLYRSSVLKFACQPTANTGRKFATLRIRKGW